MKISPNFKYVSGSFNTETGKIICIQHKDGIVDLCFKEQMIIPFTEIKLYDTGLEVDASKVRKSAYELGCEIAKRWNEYKEDKK